MTTANHRRDIDGLRAVAVFPVLAFHYGLTRWCSGGYVGVDVFFVISGFLITKMIYDGMSDGTYSISDFYQRRVRRIFPALFVVFAAILLLSCVTHFPSETAYIGESVLSAVLFVSNIFFFYSTGNYFDPHHASNPVLHTWSLSVEEQFYILFPMLMLLLKPLPARLILYTIAATTVLSFLASAIWVRQDSAGAFYLVPLRAWELLLGALVAIGAFPALSGSRVREATAAAGLFAILFAVAFYDKSTIFPGPAATLPCLGAAAIIYAGMSGTTFVGRILSLPPIRLGGLISYSLYLWHWPLFIFFADSSFGLRKKLVLASVAITIAIASWWFVERPFRQMKIYSRTVLAGGLIAMAVACVASLTAAPLSNFVSPVPARVAELLAYEDYRALPVMRAGTCFLTGSFNSLSYFKPEECLKIDPGRRNILIVGDSHAAHLWFGYQKVSDANVMQATASGCKPVIDLRGEKRCTLLMQEVFSKFLPEHHVDTIVLSARWDADNINGAIERARLLLNYADRVVISGPIPEYDETLPRILANALATGTPPEQLATKHRRREPKQTDELFASTPMPLGIRYVSVYSALCAQSCHLLVGEVPVQFDYGHLTAEGSEYVARHITTDTSRGTISP